MYYHVQISTKSTSKNSELKFDLDKDQLIERVINAYQEGRSFVVGGRIISPDDIQRIKIISTIRPSTEFREWNVNFARQGDEDWYKGEQGVDVTEDFIKGPPGKGIARRSVNTGPMIQGPRVVFVVHGRNLKARDALFNFLRSIGLHPLEWIEAVMATGKPLPFIGEILDSAFSIAQAIIVLMTPDDEAHLREIFRQPGEPMHETQLTGQARPNVIFEAGMAMGRCAERTVLIEMGSLRPFSDVGGRHIIKLNNTTQKRQELAVRLQTIGCPVSLLGTDWHTAGDFSLS